MGEVVYGIDFSPRIRFAQDGSRLPQGDDLIVGQLSQEAFDALEFKSITIPDDIRTTIYESSFGYVAPTDDCA